MKTSSYLRREIKEPKAGHRKVPSKNRRFKIESPRVISSIKRTLCDHQKGWLGGFSRYLISPPPLGMLLSQYWLALPWPCFTLQGDLSKCSFCILNSIIVCISHMHMLTAEGTDVLTALLRTISAALYLWLLQVLILVSASKEDVADGSRNRLVKQPKNKTG